MAFTTSLAVSFNFSTLAGRGAPRTAGFGLDLNRDNSFGAGDGLLAFDFNNDGRVGAAEITRSRQALLGFGGTEDLNGDGRITRAESRTAQLRGAELKPFDVDANGVLSAQELNQARARVVGQDGLVRGVDAADSDNRVLGVDPRNSRIETSFRSTSAPAPTPPPPAAPPAAPPRSIGGAIRDRAINAGPSEVFFQLQRRTQELAFARAQERARENARLSEILLLVRG